jgi:hypothetical protein
MCPYHCFGWGTIFLDFHLQVSVFCPSIKLPSTSTSSLFLLIHLNHFQDSLSFVHYKMHKAWKMFVRFSHHNSIKLITRTRYCLIYLITSRSCFGSSLVSSFSFSPQTDFTPLMWASKENHLQILLALLEYGADVDAQTEAINLPLSLPFPLLLLRHTSWSPFQNGTTALLWAICWGHLETVQILTRWGADINVPSAVSTFPPSSHFISFPALPHSP